ncbi:DUF4251 domain-containing protein [Paraflavitalea sp. CAU 1676]|uniref:DUF4251 domain-containing protein n=1 Tax=Paraflavitalea sp. CAU 1676 TaxID=3032598 RepID=UPI0023DC37A6|nr:DUF4251 domain-containing protein [Paraflavitalea sp. CAU 1676]MDF2192329.1 DUF4251 domain-containing protein [Paraflavitalea sp. CAU 1676]
MKAIQWTRMMIMVMVVSAGAFTSVKAQDTKADKKAEKAAQVKAMVESQRYVFKPQSANPMRGRTVQLTSEYTVKVSKDTIISDLPYFGRSYTAPIDPSKGGIQFNSTKFDYKLEEVKKGWQVTIKPGDVSDVQQFFLTIFTNGSATLQVTSTNRTPISFNGSVSERR